MGGDFEDESADDHVRVFLRLNPITVGNEDGDVVDEDAMQVVDDKTVSVMGSDDDEPINYELDGVFDVSATDAQVYESVCGDLARKLVEGRDCTLMTYGPLQTGKTYNMFGRRGNRQNENTTNEVNGKTKKATEPDPSSDSAEDSSSSSSMEKPTTKKKKGGKNARSDGFDDLDNLINDTLDGVDSSESDTVKSKIPNEDEEYQGFAVPLCRKIFETLEIEAADILSLGIRMSVVEIYLDRMIDLLMTGTGANDVFLQENPRGGATLLQGCAAVSCVQYSDMLNVIRHGLQNRTMSQLEPCRDSHRSTVVVQIQLEQDRVNQARRSSVLQLVDLCASEYCITESSSEAVKELDEKVSKSILALDREVMAPSPLSTITERPSLVRLLSPFCRAETVTRILLTGSKLDVDACQRTLEFGMSCMQLPPVSLPLPGLLMDKSSDDEEDIYRDKRLTELVFALSHECNKIAKTMNTPRHGPIWTAINEIQKLSHQNRPLRFYVETKREHEINAAKFGMLAKVREAERKANTQKHRMKQLESDIQILKAQNEQLKQELNERSVNTDDAHQRKLGLEHRVKEVEHSLRTSQFRESEAVVLLRQFRKFYYRLLRQVHGEDKSPGGSMLKQIWGAPDLIQLIDLDKVMVESGLMEEQEVGRDMPLSKTYLISKEALVRSVAAADAVQKNGDSKEIGEPNAAGGDVVTISSKIQTDSVVGRPETGEMTEARQVVYKTPAGRYLTMREKKLEEELLSVADQLAKVKEQLKEEQKTRKDLESTSSAVNKAKYAREVRTLKDQLTKRSNDLKAVIFKMNEIHTVSKTLQEKIADREQHVEYLEKEMGALRARESEVLTAKDKAEERLKLELVELGKKARTAPDPMWQLSESKDEGVTPPPISSRISVSFSIGRNAMSHRKERRMSKGEDENDWLDNIYRPSAGGRGTHDDDAEALRRELNYLKSQGGGASSSGYLNRKNMHNDDSENEEDFSHRSDSNNSVSGLLFMDDDGPPAVATSSEASSKANAPVNRRGSAYGGLVDAYNMNSSLENPSQSKEKTTSYGSSHSAAPTSPVKSSKAVRNSAPLLSPSKASAKKTTTKGEDDNTPEWMKKFQTIAARNHGESVIETSGSAEARELTRCSFGETLKLSHNGENQSTRDLEPSKWSPRKKKADESDNNDSFAKEFLATASAHYVDQAHLPAGNADSSEEDESEKSDAQDGQDSSSSEDPEQESSAPPQSIPPLTRTVPARMPSLTKEVPAQRSQIKSTMDDSSSSSDSDDSASDKGRPTTSSMPPAAVPVASRKKSYSSDSDSSSEPASPVTKSKHTALSPAQSPNPEDKETTQSSEATTLVSQHSEAKSFLDDSDSDSSSSSEKNEIPKTPAPPTSSGSAPAKKSSFLDDSESSDSDDDDSKAPSSSVPSPAPAPVKKSSFLDDSEGSDSDDDDSNVPSSSVPPPAPAPAKKSSFLDDSEGSDSDGDDSKPPMASPSGNAKQRNSFLDNSDSSDSDSDKNDRSQAIPTASKSSTAKLTLGDSDGGSASEEPSEHSESGGVPEQKIFWGDPNPILSLSSHGAAAKPAIPDASTGSSKGKFVIKNGKLVKGTGGKAKPKAKPNFTIKNGKLVQSSNHSGKTKPASLSQAAPDSPRRLSMTGIVSPARTNKKAGSAKKLVNKDEKPKQAAAFSIVGGKLVKASDTKSRKKKVKK